MKSVCLVIGAGAGIGGTVGRRFAREGYHACLCRRSDLDGLNSLVDAIKGDGTIRVSVPGTIREAFEAHRELLAELEGGGAVFDGGFDQAASCKSSIDYFRNPDVLGQYRANLRWRLREAGFGVLALLGAAVVASVVLLRH